MDKQYMYWRMDTWSGTYELKGTSFGKGPSGNFYIQKSDYSVSDGISFQIHGGNNNSSIAISDNSGNWTQYNSGPEYGKILDIAEGKLPLSLFNNKLYNYFWVFYFADDPNKTSCDDVIQ